jgi:N-acetylglucosaminylphosphatidylinositol deacetylase
MLKLSTHTIQIVTFDERGVSDHPNHVATYRGVRHLFKMMSKEKKRIIGLKLESTNCVRKFLGIFDLLLSYSLSDLIFTNFNVMTVIKGMAIHKSQNIWYRVLFVLFSRYTYVNTFTNIL